MYTSKQLNKLQVGFLKSSTPRYIIRKLLQVKDRILKASSKREAAHPFQDTSVIETAGFSYICKSLLSPNSYSVVSQRIPIPKSHSL